MVTTGDVVHFETGQGEHWAAIVTRVHEHDEVDLHIFPPHGTGVEAPQLDVAFVKPGTPEGAPRSWHFSERCKRR